MSRRSSTPLRKRQSGETESARSQLSRRGSEFRTIWIASSYRPAGERLTLRGLLLLLPGAILAGVGAVVGLLASPLVGPWALLWAPLIASGAIFLTSSTYLVAAGVATVTQKSVHSR